MAKAKTHFTCQSCGSQSPKWLERCTDCGAWGSLVEDVDEGGAQARPAWGASGGQTTGLIDGALPCTGAFLELRHGGAKVELLEVPDVRGKASHSSIAFVPSKSPAARPNACRWGRSTFACRAAGSSLASSRNRVGPWEAATWMRARTRRAPPRRHGTGGRGAGGDCRTRAGAAAQGPGGPARGARGARSSRRAWGWSRTCRDIETRGDRRATDGDADDAVVFHRARRRLAVVVGVQEAATSRAPDSRRAAHGDRVSFQPAEGRGEDAARSAATMASSGGTPRTSLCA
jgi:hypothetical protein